MYNCNRHIIIVPFVFFVLKKLLFTAHYTLHYSLDVRIEVRSIIDQTLTYMWPVYLKCKIINFFLVP